MAFEMLLLSEVVDTAKTPVLNFGRLNWRRMDVLLADLYEKLLLDYLRYKSSSRANILDRGGDIITIGLLPRFVFVFFFFTALE